MTSQKIERQLCRAQTEDGLFLDGLWECPDVSENNPLPTAWLLLHGTGSHFYAPGVLAQFAEQALADGSGVLRVNTRGHDIASRFSTSQGIVWGGAAFEHVSDCRKDVSAWIQFLMESGHTRIGLCGHSMGAVKSIYAQAGDHHESIKAVVAISPPRFCHANLMSHPDNDEFRQNISRAQELVKNKQGHELLFVRQPLPLMLTAETFLEKYGPGDNYDTLKFLPELKCPSLVLVGTKSIKTSSAFHGLPEAIRALQLERPDLPLTLEIVEGANTGYHGFSSEPYQRTKAWLVRIAE